MVTRSARFGFCSPEDIAWSRFDARGDMAILIGFPDSSLRGLYTACAGRAADGSATAVAKARRGMRDDGLIE